MITRVLYNKEKDEYNKVVKHPLQTWEWGDFQITQGHKVYRLGIFDNDKMIGGYSVSFHKIPKFNYSVGTILRGPAITQEMIDNITNLAIDEKAIFVKFEPDVYQKTFDTEQNPTTLVADVDFPNLHVSPKVAFYPFSYVIDLSKSEDDLLAAMHSKTRYNIKTANRHEVKIEEAIVALKAVIKSDNKDDIEAKTTELSDASSKLMERIYAKKAQEDTAASSTDAENANQQEQHPQQKERDVVDAEFEEIKDKDKK